MLAGLLGFNFVNACIGIEISGTEATTIREIDLSEDDYKNIL
jgi:electron transfer flavoprotein beta subunit